MLESKRSYDAGGALPRKRSDEIVATRNDGGSHLGSFARRYIFFTISYQVSFVYYVRLFWAISKDTIYTKLALMPWIDENLGHTLSGLTQIGNIIAKIFYNFTIFQVYYRFPW